MDPWVIWKGISLADPASLSESNRRLFAVGWLRTEVNNGGFDQLFFNSAGDVAPEAIEGAQDAGADVLAELVERAVASLGTPYPRDRTTRQARLLLLGDDNWDRLDDEYYELEATVDLDAVMRSLLLHP